MIGVREVLAYGFQIQAHLLIITRMQGLLFLEDVFENNFPQKLMNLNSIGLLDPALYSPLIRSHLIFLK